MSAPIANLELISKLGIPLAAFLTALVGSSHCLAMCGGIATAVAGNRRHGIAYQLGRLAAYLGTGALSGVLGERLLSSVWQSPIAWFVAAVTFFSMVVLGFSFWRENGNLHFDYLARWNPSLRVWNKLAPWTSSATNRAALLGLLTPLLPCGWLYGFAALAATTRGALPGAVVLGALWLGSLPSLTAGPVAVDWLRRRLPVTQRRLVGLLIIAGALCNLYGKVQAARELPSGASEVMCHSHH